VEQRGYADALYRKVAGGQRKKAKGIGMEKSLQEGLRAIIFPNSAGKYGEKAVERPVENSVTSPLASSSFRPKMFARPRLSERCRTH
jgi:hypothetical protein